MLNPRPLKAANVLVTVGIEPATFTFVLLILFICLFVFFVCFFFFFFFFALIIDYSTRKGILTISRQCACEIVDCRANSYKKQLRVKVQ